MRLQAGIISVVVVCAALALAVLLRTNSIFSNASPGALIAARGGTNSYLEFKRNLVGTTLTLSDMHMQMHVFGAALFDVEGIKGIGVCDATYDFGCFHGFFSRAISQAGDAVVGELAAACKEKYGSNSTGCEHGIGHGIMEFVGPDSLLKGLSLCNETRQANPLYGCTSGLFMEFNMPMRYASGTVVTQMRSLDRTHPRAPCDSVVPERYRTSCYFEQSAWWGHVLGDDAAAGNMCGTAANEEERNACWRGWGTVVVEKAQYDSARAQELCRLVSDSGGKDECFLGIAMRLAALSDHATDVTRVCDALMGERKIICQSLKSKH